MTTTPTTAVPLPTKALPIIAGRQMPAPGSKRDRLMKDVKAWLGTHKGASNARIAADLGVSPNRVAEARLDLSLFDALILSIPSPSNGNVVSGGLTRAALQGELTQCRHNATRLEREAIRLDKVALATADPSEAAEIASHAGVCRWQGANLRKLETYLVALVAATP